jgi:hypothetical protein
MYRFFNWESAFERSQLCIDFYEFSKIIFPTNIDNDSFFHCKNQKDLPIKLESYPFSYETLFFFGPNIFLDIFPIF